jgi:hypothetical protein
MLLKVIATLTAAFFAGGGLFVSIVLYPAIMTESASAVAQFGNMYRHAAPWQGSNAIICLLAALTLSVLTTDWRLSIGGFLVGASVPFTLFVMRPVNNRRLDENAPLTADETVPNDAPKIEATDHQPGRSARFGCHGRCPS